MDIAALEQLSHAHKSNTFAIYHDSIGKINGYAFKEKKTNKLKTQLSSMVIPRFLIYYFILIKTNFQGLSYHLHLLHIYKPCW